MTGCSHIVTLNNKLSFTKLVDGKSKQTEPNPMSLPLNHLCILVKKLYSGWNDIYYFVVLVHFFFKTANFCHFTNNHYIILSITFGEKCPHRQTRKALRPSPVIVIWLPSLFINGHLSLKKTIKMYTMTNYNWLFNQNNPTFQKMPYLMNESKYDFNNNENWLLMLWSSLSMYTKSLWFCQ